VTHEPLPVARVLAALDAWGIGGTDTIVEPIPRGATADVFLVRRGAQKWVAKYAYQERAYAEAGLAASEVLDLPGYTIGTPVRTAGDGALTHPVEWPSGHEHPLALLRFVEGRPLLSVDEERVAMTARVCGRVHAQLLDLDPRSVGIEVSVERGPYLPPPPWDLGDHQWLDEVAFDLDRRTFEHRPHVRCGVAVWDGPDIRITDDGALGLIDFGHTMWQPIVHAVANRSLTDDYEDLDQLQRFLDVVQEDLPLTPAELDAFTDFRRLSAATYARWAANQVVEHGKPIEDWLARLISYLRSSGPTST
jgi:Ser/Thr protein kinase RdoA (MazF antagonist)